MRTSSCRSELTPSPLVQVEPAARFRDSREQMVKVLYFLILPLMAAVMEEHILTLRAMPEDQEGEEQKMETRVLILPEILIRELQVEVPVMDLPVVRE